MVGLAAAVGAGAARHPLDGALGLVVAVGARAARAEARGAPVAFRVADWAVLSVDVTHCQRGCGRDTW